MRWALLLFILLSATFVSSALDSPYQFGDILFVDSPGGQSLAVKKATNSKFSHCGIIIEEGSKLYLFEAVEPVQVVLLDEVLNNKKNGKLVVKRIKNANKLFTPFVKAKILGEKNKLINLHYDPYFDWSDNEYYCSELVWKVIYRSLGIELCALRPLRDYNLKDPIVVAKLKERYGDKIPYEQKMVSPEDLYQSSFLEAIPKVANGYQRIK